MVPGIYNWYFISNKGNVYSNHSDKILKPGIDSKGYPYVALSTINGPKNMRIHRLVMLAFDYHEGCEKEIINHIDGTKNNPKIYNLEWTTYSKNARHAYDMDLCHGGAKGNISDEDVRRVCELLIENKLSARQIAEIVGTSVDTVHSINTGKTHTRISKEYNLQSRKISTLTEDQIKSVCLYYQNTTDLRKQMLKFDYIKSALSYNNIPINSSTINCGERILYRQSHVLISKDYKF